MKNNPDPDFNIRKHKLFKRVGASTTALMVFAAQVTPALATIDNTALQWHYLTSQGLVIAVLVRVM